METYLPLPEYIADKEVFEMRIKRECMANAGIMPNGIAIVGQCGRLEASDIVISMADGSKATVKRFYA